MARALRRKTKTTRITSRTEIISERSTSLSDARMVVVRSRTTVMSNPLRDDCHEKWKLRADPVVGLNNVGAGLAEDMDGDRGIVVEIARIADVRGGVGDLGDIG